MKAHYKIFTIAGIVIFVAGLALTTLSWKDLFGNIIKDALEARGIQDVHLTLSEVGLSGSVFQGISVGKGSIFTMDHLALHYSLQGDEISADAEDLGLSKDSLKVNATKASGHIKNGEGSWNLQNLQAQDGSVVLPVITASGKLKSGPDTFFLSGGFKSIDSAYRANFTLEYPFAHSNEAQLRLINVSVPWKGGTLMTKDVAIPLAGRQPVKMLVHIQRISTDALLHAMTGQNILATGTVSGSLPLTIERDGTVSFGAGTLQADGAGRISMPADAIPEGNEQVGVVRDILKNFHYKGLSIDVNSNKGGVSLLIALEGNNPDMYNGRPVKLNVRLAGDVLGYIHQNVLLLTSPETLLKQDQK